MSLPIALDALGGDNSPHEIVTGARRAVDELGLEVILVGPPDLIGDPQGLPVVACTEVIGMDEDPAKSVRTKKDSSLVRAAELVRDGHASAMVSAGNTGATMASALLRMGRLPGVIRPCIATPLPNPGRAPTVMVDAGANAECTPEMLVQFAVMGEVFARTVLGLAKPTIGLLNVGIEELKGNDQVKQAAQMLRRTNLPIQFHGFIEGDDITANAVMIRRLPRTLRATAEDGTANPLPDLVAGKCECTGDSNEKRKKQQDSNHLRKGFH